MQDKKIVEITAENEAIYLSSIISFHKIFSENIDYFLSRRQWLQQNPLGGLKEFILFQNNIILAYNYFIPVPYNHSVCLLSGGSLVNPNHKGVFVSFYTDVLNVLKKQEYLMVYGFSNKNSFPIMISKYGAGMLENENYKQIRIVGAKNIFKDILEVQLKDISTEQNCSDPSLSPWLSWRINKPRFHYKICLIKNKNVIYKIFENQIDFISIPSFISHEEYVKIIYSFYSKFICEYPILNVILSDKGLFDLINKHFEIEYDNYERHFCYKFFKDVNAKNQEFSIEMINSDVY